MHESDASRPFDDKLPASYRLRHIRSGYRASTNQGSCRDVLATACVCHNESGNIFTHLLAFVIFIGCLLLVVTQVNSS